MRKFSYVILVSSGDFCLENKRFCSGRLSFRISNGLLHKRIKQK